MIGGFDSLLADTYWPGTQEIVRAFVAVLLGGLVGLERELRDKPAGFRTIVMICVGACIFTMVSYAAGGPDMQSTRIAAQIVTGIGFLGAGAILRDRASVFGLTTAATIWAVAAIGMAVGFGYIGLATLGTVVILVALLAFDVVEHRIGELRDIQDYHIAAHNTDETLPAIDRMFDTANLQVRKRFCHEEEASIIVHIVAMGAKVAHDRLRQQLIRDKEYTLRQA